MGVSGCGKSAVGRALADELGWRFIDADDVHPPQNIDKMSRGIPLSDADRAPWLDALAALIVRHLELGETGVMACSALKAAYRRRLQVAAGVHLVYLKGTYELCEARLKSRAGHYMPALLLASQFADLEEPGDALTLDAAQPVEALVAHIRRYFDI
ncbi:MAG: gluconokinase [Anaerolineae bacterium]|nr:gluconokinase [Anaerolineae bacterium]